ncbi:unnamed protein product [Chondrus crispus]|uniref:Uncharacterized protein n=1 Tax=Chondrus crispus TaxID=2769 RepID=R7QCT6_CHOCR|nr:unnamed protein product [Chondrus crispus]CDF35270.1 unnamed protein product [Chondrus crispus]|eukprot:XP_005715089.1 unnamed protein product [Chondrus crispus]
MLVSHMVYFTLTSAFSPRLYATWAYAGLALAFVGAVFCSLMQLLREDIVKEAMRVDEEDGGHAADTLLGQEPVDRGLARFVAQVTVPLYQVFVTVSVFGAVVFWAAILPVQSADISYPLLALNAIAPAVAVLDVLLSMSIEFRLVYVLLVALFNAAYAGTLYVFYKTDGIYVYNFINPSQEKGAFIAKTTGLAVASIVAGLFVYSVTAFSGLMFRRRSAEKKTKKGDKDDSTADVKSVSDKDVELESQVTLDSSQDVQSEEKRNISAPTEDSHEFDEDEVVVADMDEKSKGNSKSSMEKRNRHSVPTQSPELARSGSNRRWYRSSTAGRLQGVISLSSLAEEAVEDRPISVWEEKGVDSAHAPQESEYFTMPAAYNGGRNEVVKLTPVVHAGTQFARSGSGRQLFKSGSGRHFVRSGSGRAIARSGSGRAIVRSSSRASSRSSVVGPRP